MRSLFGVICLILLGLHEARAQVGYAVGVEAGVAQLKSPRDTLAGTSLMLLADYEVDPLVAFYGLAGFESAEESGASIDHRSFGGGVALSLLPVLDLRLGLGLNLWESEKNGLADSQEALSPQAALTVHQTTGALKWGASATGTRSGDYQSVALRVFALLLLE